MAAPAVRPRFELALADDPDRVMAGLRSRLSACPRCTGVSVGRHAELFVPEAERRAWSPWLSVTAEAGERGGSLVRGRFSPHPSVWTLYMFLAFAVGFAVLVGTTWGYAQWAMGERPWALASVPLGAAALAGLYVASLVGQRLGADQMTGLEAALRELVREDGGSGES